MAALEDLQAQVQSTLAALEAANSTIQSLTAKLEALEAAQSVPDEALADLTAQLQKGTVAFGMACAKGMSKASE